MDGWDAQNDSKDESTMIPDTTPTTKRIAFATLAAMLSISVAGLVHRSMGMEWGISQQILYALVGGVLCWKVAAPMRGSMR